MLCRFNEWGRSIAELQKEQLRTNQGHEYFFTAYYCDEESKELQSLGSEIAGGFMSAQGLLFSKTCAEKK